ncbi:hypothetical protein INR49_020026 [Caranx melampygus]|nr:hypothetical protein INR49_020026 [Caranx melampygus]
MKIREEPWTGVDAGSGSCSSSCPFTTTHTDTNTHRGPGNHSSEQSCHSEVSRWSPHSAQRNWKREVNNCF